MDKAIVYKKTAKGEEEVKTRAAKLPFTIRTMLILMDGSKSLGQMEPVAARLGIKEDYIGLLAGQGLIAPVGGATGAPAAAQAPSDEFARFAAAKQFMNESAVNALGMRSFFFTLKLEKCANRKDLAELLEAFHAAIAKGGGPQEAEVLTERARELLA